MHDEEEVFGLETQEAERLPYALHLSPESGQIILTPLFALRDLTQITVSSSLLESEPS